MFFPEGSLIKPLTKLNLLMIKLNKATLIMKAIRLSMININVTTKNQDRCNKIEIKTITNLE